MGPRHLLVGDSPISRGLVKLGSVGSLVMMNGLAIKGWSGLATWSGRSTFRLDVRFDLVESWGVNLVLRSLSSINFVAAFGPLETVSVFAMGG